jgi:hypothetical protein
MSARSSLCKYLIALQLWTIGCCTLLLSSPSNAHEGHSAVADVQLTAQSGPWSSPQTWKDGKVPGKDAKVLIREGHRVMYDLKSDEVIRGINIAGRLTFATDKDTLLNVGLIKIQAGEAYSEEGFDCDHHVEDVPTVNARPALEVGTSNKPVDAKHTAIIRLHYVEGLDKQSCPAIVCCGGRMDFHGAELNRSWVKLGADAAAKADTIRLVESVTGWRAGDRIIVTATNTHGSAKELSETEERLIKSVNGDTITLSEPLKYAHRGSGDFRGEVANLSRNVIVESANPDGIRGHTMFHRGSAGSLTYTEFRHLGKKDVLGRYSLHFHLIGDTMRGSSVVGCSIWDSHNRWLTIHGTNHLVVRDNVGYQSIGHGFFLEDGTEVFNVLDRNLAVAARQGKRLPQQVLPFDQNEGAGFWWANSLNTFTDNIAANCDRYGFRYEATQSSGFKLTLPVPQADGSLKPVDIRTLPFVRFDGNEAHSSEGLYGINLGEGVNRVGPDAQHPFVVRNTKIWDIHYAFRPQVPSLLVENMQLHQFVYGVYHPNFDNHVYRNLTLSDSNAAEPFNRGHDDDSVQHGLLTVDGLTFDRVSSGGTPLIQISDDNATGLAASHFRNVQIKNWNDNSKERALSNLGAGPRPQPKTPHGVPIYFHDWFAPGEHAEVVSTKSPEYLANPAKFEAVHDLTGNESRSARVTSIDFPQLLQPIDDQPPTTVITNVQHKAGKRIVRGTAADNGDIAKVTVNGGPATSLRSNFAEWQIELLESAGPISSHAQDAAGNVEPQPHTLTAETSAGG